MIRQNMYLLKQNKKLNATFMSEAHRVMYLNFKRVSTVQLLLHTYLKEKLFLTIQCGSDGIIRILIVAANSLVDKKKHHKGIPTVQYPAGIPEFYLITRGWILS